MREFGEETSLLTALSAYLSTFDVLITYNGKTYDQPLLETRYRMNRTRPPFASPLTSSTQYCSGHSLSVRLVMHRRTQKGIVSETGRP